LIENDRPAGRPLFSEAAHIAAGDSLKLLK
jgi:hypothetical protein